LISSLPGVTRQSMMTRGSGGLLRVAGLHVIIDARANPGMTAERLNAADRFRAGNDPCVDRGIAGL
jgi:hypothetical protein